MREKIGTIGTTDVAERPQVDKRSLWFAEETAKIEKEQKVHPKKAIQVLFGKLLTEIKKIGADKQDVVFDKNGDMLVKSYSKANLEARGDLAGKLTIVIRQILEPAELEKVKQLSNSNKFKPVDDYEVTKLEILDEKDKYIDKTRSRKLNDQTAKEVASCKKLISILCQRIVELDGVQNLADIKNLATNHPELAADLGKIMEATDILNLFEQKVEKIEQRLKEKDEALVRARRGILRPIEESRTFLKELLNVSAKEEDEETKERRENRRYFFDKIKELKEKSEFGKPEEWAEEPPSYLKEHQPQRTLEPLNIEEDKGEVKENPTQAELRNIYEKARKLEKNEEDAEEDASSKVTMH